ncbi:MAG: TraR/DksA family transcriptional regulator [Alphaproteobacteria bacterium]|nr:TraR/DksA family transcriptional regulator [Alphaproteobacteria bacterium]MDX5368727.1 TraR/DksA family transcriptional regulator [Alphaproteobacteria bacterium]MDX5463469.1 TraR/DksA family transcriptional regulator [Alphaproteobacteria bacterium]
MTDAATYEKRLRARLEELSARLAGIEHDLDEPGSPDFEEQATEREGDEVLEDLGNAGLKEIRMIEAALDRVAKGTYGVCTVCGGEIEAARLDAVPYTPMCSACAREAG